MVHIGVRRAPAWQGAVNNIFAMVGGDKCSLNVTTSENVTAHQCCIPSGVDITGFICKPEAIQPDGSCIADSSGQEFKIDGFYDSAELRGDGSGFYDTTKFRTDVADEVACICCSGALGIDADSRLGRTEANVKVSCVKLELGLAFCRRNN